MIFYCKLLARVLLDFVRTAKIPPIMKSKLTQILPVALLAFGLASAPLASASVIDFESGVTLLPDGTRIDTVGPVTVSRNLFPNFQDGMRYVSGGGNPGAFAGGWYGEHGEYFQFNAPVYLNSLDLMEEFGYATAITITALDSSLAVLASHTINAPAQGVWQTMNFGTNNVSRIVVDFTSNINAYGVGRTHAWIGVDNINYDSASVPEAGTTVALFGAALLGLAALRRKS
jgi:hypothetical protein